MRAGLKRALTLIFAEAEKANSVRLSDKNNCSRCIAESLPVAAVALTAATGLIDKGKEGFFALEGIE